MVNSSFILKELNKSGRVILKAGNAVIKCPFHDQHNPMGTCSISLGEKIECGVWNCWSCKSSGRWNSLASKLGLRLDIGDTNDDEIYTINSNKISIYTEIDEDKLELFKLPDDFKWKSYSRKLLRKMGAKLIWNDISKDYYLYLPITYIDEYYGYIRCKIHPDSIGPKYWFALSKKLPYPSDYLIDKDTRTIVLVEGVADVFRLLRNGISALALLGTTLTSKMLDILEGLAVEKVILCLDGDEAGRNAVLGRKGIASMLEKNNIETRVLFPPEDKDPDNMPKSYINVLKYMIEKGLQ